MTAVLNVVLPVFGIILAGYLCGRFKVLGAESSEALNRFVYFVALPALFFISLARVDLAVVFNGPYLTAVLGGMGITFMVSILAGRLLLTKRVGVLALQGLSAIFSNAGYMGIPLLGAAFGAEGTLAGVIAAVSLGALLVTLGVILLELDVSGGGAGRVLRNLALSVARNPLLVAALAGVAVSGSKLALPGMVESFFSILSNAAGPCALFAMGLFLASQRLGSGLGEVAWLTVLKLILHPLVTWVLAYHVLELDRVWAASAVILAALPTGALVFVLAQQYGLYVQRATAVILISTTISVVTLSLVFALLGH